MKWVKRILAVAAALAVVATVAWGFMPRPVPVDTAAIGRGMLEVTLAEEGRTRVRDRFVVFASVAGHMARLSLRSGDAVAAGDTLATLAPLPPQPLDARARAQAAANVRAAEADLNQAGQQAEAAAAELAYARQRLEDLRALRRTEHVAQDAVNAAETRHAVAEAALRSAEFARAAANYRLEAARAALVEDNAAPGRAVTVRAPVSGRVLRVLRESEGPVLAGEPLVEIGDVAALEVVADFLSRDAARIQPRMKARLERWGGAGSLDAVVRLVEPSGFSKISALGVEEQRVNVVLDLAAGTTAAELGDGFRV
ncbi:MAG: HlyD family efflux transporter periplasmic adaptor subunit, partial [Planctomycetes bacterium]|nr:HlyD family efflux transporter periplasmic adaptor subunit [Planctomycetota bacterium]